MLFRYLLDIPRGLHRLKSLRVLLAGFLALIVITMVFRIFVEQPHYQQRQRPLGSSPSSKLFEAAHQRQEELFPQIDVLDYFFKKATSARISLIALVDQQNSNSVRNDTDENAVLTFGIFEKDSEKFWKRFKAKRHPWILVALTGKDYRLMRPTRNESRHAEMITHYFLLSSTLIHVAIVFPRNDFFWVAGVDDPNSNAHFFSELSFSIPIPMAVDAFECDFRSIRADWSHEFCVPRDSDRYAWQMQYSQFHECHYEEIVFKFKDEFNGTEELYDWTRNRNAVREVVGIAKDLRMPMHLFGGTLLGWYRQCNQIVHSSDADLAVLPNELKPEFLARMFNSSVMKVCCRYGTPTFGLEYRSYTRVGSFWLDVFTLAPTKHPEKYLCILWGGETIYTFTYPPRRGVCSAELFDTLVFIPCNYEEFILKEFGPDGWFAPKGGYPHINMKRARPYLEKEADFMKYGFTNFTCDHPDLVWGCDEIAPDILNSTFYYNYTTFMKDEMITDDMIK